MSLRPLVWSFAALLLGAFSVASAQNAYTARPMNVRAGPNRDYPLVAQLGAGESLDVHGCLSDWSWCDASFDDSRGWIYAGGLSFVYQGERVPLYTYGPRLGLPIIAFSLLSYWDDYYRGRPWYSQRNVWVHRRLPPHLRPPGRTRAGPPQVPQAGRPVGGRPTPRGEERGRATPPVRRGAQPQGRGAQPQERSRGSQPQGRPSSRANTGRNAHGNEGRQDHEH
jgi:uncharacterized protein YraI